VTRRIVAAILAVGLVFGLTACNDDTVSDIERNARLKQACEKAGGELYNAAPGWRCDLSTEDTK
jgi:ABC-type proline/glycine betaine transport system substrate-binding protein